MESHSSVSAGLSSSRAMLVESSSGETESALSRLSAAPSSNAITIASVIGMKPDASDMQSQVAMQVEGGAYWLPANC